MALEWLKTILGAGYTAEVDTQIAQEIGKGFVARTDFNAKNEELKQAKTMLSTHETQLEGLKAAAGNADELKTQIATLQEQNKQDKTAHDAEMVRLHLDAAVDKALTDAGAKNNTATKALLSSFLKDAKMGADGTVRGLPAEIEALAKTESAAFMFKAAETAQSSVPQIQGMKPGEALPTGGAGGAMQQYQTRLEEARKTGNTVEAVVVKREAAENGIILT